MTSGEKPKRVAIYARVSTTDQHPGMQVDELRRVCSQRGWEIAGEYVDAGYSGSKDRRPELDRLMQDVHRGMVGIVLVWRFDRFARSVRHLVTALEDFRSRSVDFISVMDGIDTCTPAGRFTFHVVAAVAELERELIRERTRAGIAAARRRGAQIGRPRVKIDMLRAKSLMASGLSFRKAARVMGIGTATLYRALHLAPESGDPITSHDGCVEVQEKSENSRGPSEKNSSSLAFVSGTTTEKSPFFVVR
jgi:DNA invertase Pin-like site-specific DNA recombinase